MAQSTKSSDDARAAMQAAAAGTKAAGRAVTLAAGRARKPLIVGAAGAAGVLGGLAIRNHEGR